MLRLHILVALTLTIIQLSFGQYTTRAMSPGQIYERLESFNFLGNALFVAAHPDDENTRMISHLVNEENAHTTYLSLTRGDGGQNLIGPEISELLGVIRTQELLAARRTDGGHQMFTRANDFGFSKNAEETISIWDDELVKKDVVWAIRKLRPDVIINRFDHLSSGKTHGHHTASAMLSFDLFEKASDEKSYPEQLAYVQPWKAERLFFNTSWWFYGSQEAFDKADKSQMLSIDCGTYFPQLGKSNNEIAALSRSNHKCQGFGSTGTRGDQSEYLQLLKGSLPPNRANVFEGINTTWTRVQGGAIIGQKVDKIMSQYSFLHPENSLPGLMEVYTMLEGIKDEFWRERKRKELEGIIAACAGLYIEAIAADNSAVAGEQIKVSIEVTNRLAKDFVLTGLHIVPSGKDTLMAKAFGVNEAYYQSFEYTIPSNAEHTAPYWLEEEGSLGMYKVSDQQLIGLPETPKQYGVSVDVTLGGKAITFEVPISFKFNDAEDGEVFEPFEILPELFVNTVDKVYVFADDAPREIKVVVKSGAKNQSGQVSLPLPEGWKSAPSSQEFSLKEKGESKTFAFMVTPPKQASDITITPEVLANGNKYARQLISIDYDHIPLQRVLRPATARVVKMDIKKSGNKVAYIDGAGDEIPQSMKQIGYQVTEMKLSEVTVEKLKEFDALVMGVRAYNTLDEIKFKQPILLDYVAQGGTMIVQYNTNRGLNIEEIGPYPIKLSRERVTEEDAVITVLEKDHPIVNFPNKISASDFEGWVQERGLYFGGEWSAEYKAILRCNDKGEDPRDGGLLVAKHGAGHYIYTGYSLFRQLPAGVPGAYRLFANMLSLGQEKRP